ncbi:MAG: hypothetical protein BWX47_01236 [candidate division Hyd24-12 bacterium ADurb.Bin004]|jgi:hypothetical protein|nr:MAG: hypothetical protein BWX47_01236 [candidate division Hyd24-12 bacterium ADurb.Bin004]
MNRLRRRENTRNRLVRGILIELGIVALLALTLLVGLRIMNKRLGLSEEPADQEVVSADLPAIDSLPAPAAEEAADAPTETVADRPESSWTSTPCSLFVSATSDAVTIQLPEAPTTDDIPLETMLLVRAWGGLAGLDESQAERLFTFIRNDTIYVDAPRAFDPEGLVRTVEGRFVNYTRLFPLVSGATMEGCQDGLPVRGVRDAI